MPNGDVVTPGIRDAERLQGFDPDWTLPAEEVRRRGFRWKLVGNAVTVDVAEWIGRRLRNPGAYSGPLDTRRRVPMTDRLTAAMKDHFARYRFASYNGKPTPLIFHHETSWRHHKAGDRMESLRTSFESAVKRAKLPAELRQHDFRHRRVTEWLAEEKPAALVQLAMGHSDIRTTLGYAHLVKQHLKSLVGPGNQANVPRNVPQQGMADAAPAAGI